MKHKTQNGNSDRAMRQYVITEFKLFVFLVGIVISVITPFFYLQRDIALIQKDIETIQTNHMSHLEFYAEQIKDNTSEITNVKNEQVEQLKELVKLNTLLEGHVDGQ